MGRFHVLLTGMLLLVPLALHGQQEVEIPGEQLPVSAENIARGKEIYTERCSFCHGVEGKGNGPVADYLYPRPRDFTLAVFKLRTTLDGDLPLDRDLYRTISRGIPGTAMPEWGPLLSEAERWQVIYYIKSFGAEFFAELESRPVEVGKRIPASPEAIARGKEIYQKMKCFQCHGQKGRGDGVSSGELKDDWGFEIYPFNLAEAWKFKGGSRAEDIYMRFTTGVNGTPMPSFASSLSDEERWELAYYVVSLARPERAGSEVVLVSGQVDGPLPKDPDAAAWRQAKGLAIPLAGQVITKPRWQNNSITTVYLKSIYNKDEIAFRLEWDDRSKDVAHDSAAVDIEALMADTYVPARHLFKAWKLRDAICLQFPVRIPSGPEKPHFFWGQAGKKVNLWKWHADWAESEGHRSAVLEMNGAGYARLPQAQPDSSQATFSQSRWSEGTWRVVLWRSLRTPDRGNDIQFEPGRLIPLAVQAWDGGRGETDRIMALSAWAYTTLEPPRALAAYLYALLGMGLAGGLEYWFVRRQRQTRHPAPPRKGAGAHPQGGQ